MTFFLIEKAKYFGFFYSEFMLEISTISYEKVKKKQLNVESKIAFSKKLKNKRHLSPI